MNFLENYYRILNISNQSSERDIKKSYYKLSFDYHPDRGGDAEMFRKISDAYKVLIDPIQRSEYDTKSKFGRSYDESTEFLRYDFSNEAESWDEGKLNDFAKKEQLNIVYRIGDKFDGSIEYERWVVCKGCKGSGKDMKSKIEIRDNKGKLLKMFDSDSGCDFCEGSGKEYNGEPCSFCFGQGKIGNKSCKLCKGEKRTLGKQKLSGITLSPDKDEHKIESMGNFSKDIPGKVGHLWILKKTE